MRLKQYLEENIDINVVKAKIAKLRKSKLTDLGRKRLQYLEDLLIRQGIFENETKELS